MGPNNFLSVDIVYKGENKYYLPMLSSHFLLIARTTRGGEYNSSHQDARSWVRSDRRYRDRWFHKGVNVMFHITCPCLGGEGSCGDFQGRFLFLFHFFLQIMVVFCFDIVPSKAQWISFDRPREQESRWSSLLVHLVAYWVVRITYQSFCHWRFCLTDEFLCTAATHMPAFTGWHSIFSLLITRISTDCEPLITKNSQKIKKTNTSFISLRRSSQNWLSGNSSRNSPSSKLPPVSYSNQILVTFELLKRPSSSARLCRWPIRKGCPLPTSVATLGANDFIHQLGDPRFAPN